MKVSDTEYPMYLFKVKDMWGRFRIVGYGLVRNETKQVLEQLFSCFIEMHGAEVTNKVKFFFTDNAEALVAAVKSQFPLATHFGCRFHTHQVVI